MNTKVVLFTLLVGLAGYTAYTVVDMKKSHSLEVLQTQNSTLDKQSKVLGAKNIDTYPAHVQAVYNAIPAKLWKLGNNKNLDSTEIEAEVKRIRSVIGTSLPHVSNKFVWIVNNTPVQADLKANPIVYKFDQGKYMRLRAPYSLAEQMTEDQMKDLLAKPTDEIVDLSRSIVDAADKAYKESAVKRNLLDLAMQLDNLSANGNDIEATKKQLEGTLTYETLIKLNPNFNLDDFLRNPKVILDEYEVDYKNYNLFQNRRPAVPATSGGELQEVPVGS